MPQHPIDPERVRRLKHRREIRRAEREPKRCPRCGLLEPHVCLQGRAWARVPNPEPARVERSR